MLSVGCGAPVLYHFSPAREHDSRHLPIDESWRGYGLLADLAYASLDRLQACDTHGVCYVIRLKENWKPKVDYLARGEVTQAFFPGTDLDALLATKRSSWMAALLMRMYMWVPEKSGCMSAWLASSRRKATVFSSRICPRGSAAAGRQPLPRTVGGGTQHPAG